MKKPGLENYFSAAKSLLPVEAKDNRAYLDSSLSN
jgi:hypothetical protein